MRAGIIFFCFFYTAVVFNPEETADNLEALRRLHPRHPPGQEHRRVYLDYVLTRITVIGAAYLTDHRLLPEYLHRRARAFRSSSAAPAC